MAKKQVFKTKKELIRSCPNSWSTKQVIDYAKSNGVELTEKTVWTVRSELRTLAKKEKMKPKTLEGAVEVLATNEVKEETSVSLAKQMKILILKMGTDRAERIYNSVMSDIRKIIETR